MAEGECIDLVARGPIVNDNRHSQLSLAHRPAQVRITELENGTGTAALGRAQVKEIDSRRCLTDFTMGDRVTGVVWSINPYVGCTHSCRYCYVPDTMHMERGRWGSYVIAKYNLPKLLQSEIKRFDRKTVYLSTSTDPYQAAEREKRITRRCLSILAKHDWPVEILTRSPLVLRDTDLFAQFGQIRIGMSVPTLDDGARRVFEPAAPSIASRLSALRKLADRGFTTFVNYTPAYPFTGGIRASDAAETFAAAGVKWVNTSYWIRMASYLGTMFDKLRGTGWSDIPRFIGSQQRQAAQRTQLAKALKAVNVPLRTGFFNPPFEERERIRLELPIEMHGAQESLAFNPELCLPTGPALPGSQWGPVLGAGAG